MKRLTAAVLACFTTTAAHADMLSDMSKREAMVSKAMIGKTFWIAKPFNSGLALCQLSSGQPTACKTIFNIEFTVKSVVPTPSGPAEIAVELPDHRKGYISSLFRDHFLPSSFSFERRAEILQCAISGPRIGMSASQVNECWGPPAKVNSTATAAGTLDQLVFPNRGYVYLTDGVVSAVQTSH